MNAGTPLGLSFASGINAYLPLLAFAVAVRWLHLYTINTQFAFITSDWFMIILAILVLLDFIADKIPVVDHGWDAINTVIRPLAGALVAAASSQQVTLPVSSASLSLNLLSTAGAAAGNMPMSGVGLIVMALLGGMLAALAHTSKATTRLVSTATTVGFFNIILSFCEDVLVVMFVLIALFAPAIMLALIVLFVLLVGPRVLRLWNKLRLRKRATARTV